MNYQQYYTNSFSFDVSKMQLKQGSPFTRYLLLHDGHATFFGGAQWQEWEKDLEKIAPANRLNFVISLFYMVMLAFALQKHFPQTYQVYRSLTRFPVFGEERDGAVFLEHPVWILLRPLMADLFTEKQLLEQVGTSLPRFKTDFHLFSEAFLASLPFDTLLGAYLLSNSNREGAAELQGLSAKLEAMLKS